MKQKTKAVMQQELDTLKAAYDANVLQLSAQEQQWRAKVAALQKRIDKANEVSVRGETVRDLDYGFTRATETARRDSSVFTMENAPLAAWAAVSAANALNAAVLVVPTKIAGPERPRSCGECYEASAPIHAFEFRAIKLPWVP